MSVTWYVNLDADGKPWTAYSDADSTKIEKAHARKAKSVILNDNYKIDFVHMRQVRRDDADRWRAIKRGGSATDKAPGEASEAEDEEAADDPDYDDAAEQKKADKVVKAAPDATWPIPAAAAAAGDKKAKKKDDEESSEASAPAAAAAKKASSVVSVSSAATDKLVTTLKAQLADMENELTQSETVAEKCKHNERLAKEELAAANKKLEQASETAKKEQAKAVAAAIVKATADAEKAASEKIAKSTKEAAVANAKLAKLEDELRVARGLQSQLDEVRAQYAGLINTLRKSVTDYDRAKGQHAPAAAAAAVSRKRERDADEEDAEPARPSTPVAKAAPPAKKPKAASPVPPASPVAAPMDDEDATQPMVAPDHGHAAAGDDDDVDMNGMAKYAPPVRSNFLVVAPMPKPIGAPHTGVPMSFARVPPSHNSSNAHLVFVGYRGGLMNAFKINASTGVGQFVKMTMARRPAHRFARPSAKNDEGEDYSQAQHVHAIGVLPRKQSGEYLVCAGEGRLLRTYDCRLGAGTMTFVAEIDVGENSWVTAITPVEAPDDDGRQYIAVGISGATHGVQVYSTTKTTTALKFERTYVVRSEEVRGIAQLSDGRLVVAGCSSEMEGKLNECGSIEIWSWASTDASSGRQFLNNDIEVHSSVGLRCNGVRVFKSPVDNRDHLLAAYEYCSNGARQLVEYTFYSQPGGLETAAGPVQIEPKNNPPVTENTFTSLDVLPDGSRCVAMTYGGKLLVYDLAAKRKIHTLDAHPESENEECTHCCLSTANDGSGILLTMGGKAEISAWTSR